MADTDLLEVLAAIDPAALDYSEWSNIGMALKHEGHTASDWDAWSRRDSERYKSGECFRKWDSFRGSDSPVTGGTIVAIARSQGWSPVTDEGRSLDWEDVIGSRDEQVIIDTAWVEPADVSEPEEWDPVADLTKYLETLFEANENVGYVTTAWEKDGRYLPTKGNWDRTAGQLIEELNKAGGDICSVFGDYKEEAGAWIRFNPLDGHGCRNDNVTEFRYALVESDTMDVAMQEALIRQLELPVACLVHSGGKSVHAIVRIDATDYDEYRKRVDHLYSVCKKNGLEIDSQNKNPSRLSRLPGATRNGIRQRLMATNIGRRDWAEWNDWMEAETDTLPVDITNGDDEWDDEIAPPTEIIEGILGTNEKLMISSSSKAGKSIALLEMCAAVANGDSWMGARCRQGDVLYVNFELKKESRKRRVKSICTELGYSRENAHRMHFFDLRGHSAPLDRLTTKIVRQAAKYKCSVIIIDPIYKVMTGDENNAEAVSSFCNQLDALGRLLDCSIVYCHHYSKGQQGQKSSMDRASGSGVFARDADALIAMTELDVTDALHAAYLNTKTCEYITSWLERHGHGHLRADMAQDVTVVEKAYRSACHEVLPQEAMNELIRELDVLGKAVSDATAWRLESTLRDFAPHKPMNVWYRYPIHEFDDTSMLGDAKLKDMADLVKAHKKAGQETAKDRDLKRIQVAVEQANMGEPPTTQQVIEYLGWDPKSRADKTKLSRRLGDLGYERSCVDKSANLYVIQPKEEV